MKKRDNTVPVMSVRKLECACNKYTALYLVINVVTESETKVVNCNKRLRRYKQGTQAVDVCCKTFKRRLIKMNSIKSNAQKINLA